MSEHETFQSPSGAAADPVTPASEIQQEIRTLRKLLTWALTVMLLIAGSVTFALRKQMMMTREEVGALRANVKQIEGPWEKEKPQVKVFIAQLQEFASRHPDYAAIMEKYSQHLTQAGLMTANLSGAIPTAPPGEQK